MAQPDQKSTKHSKLDSYRYLQHKNIMNPNQIQTYPSDKAFNQIRNIRGSLHNPQQKPKGLLGVNFESDVLNREVTAENLLDTMI
jgi:acyl-CoA-binding protein